MNTLYKTIGLFILLVTSYNLLGQVPIEKSNKEIFILGKKYYLHEVKNGQTLYSISKAYNVSEQQIISENSELNEGLKAGAEIKIPMLSVSGISKIDKNDEYIYHTIEKKQTLYFLTRKYKITEGELIGLNPQIKYGLKPGQVVKVPVPGTSAPIANSDYEFHTVQPGETLFSLAQRYGIEISSLKMENPELQNDGPKTGQVLKIPKGNSSFSEILEINHNTGPNIDYDPLYFEQAGVTPCNEFKYNNNITFKVAVLLPLFIQENYNQRTSGKYYKNTERFYEFYQGLLLAAKKMKSAGVSVEFFIKDTKANSDRVREILSLSNMRDMDLIVGPVYSKPFNLASAFAKENKINIVAPFKLKSENLVVSNPYIFLASPSQETEIANISKHLANSYDRSIVIIHNNSKEEEKIINTYKNKLVKSFSSFEHINHIVFKQVNYKTGGASAIEDALSIGLDNIIVVPSNDRVFITKVATKLNYLTKKYKITVFGMHPWEQYGNVELDYLRNLKFHYGTTSYIESENKAVKNFDHQYNTYYKKESSIFAYLGYDVTNYFLNEMKNGGKHFQFCLLGSNVRSYSLGLRFDFNFERVSPFSGFENNWLCIVKINDDLNLVKVK